MHAQLQRGTYLGGGDAAAILGVSPWRTPLAVYLDKVGDEWSASEESEPMRWGLLLEPVVAEEYSRRTGRKLSAGEVECTHPVHPFLAGHIDRTVDGDPDRIVEIKTAGRGAEWGEELSDDLPAHYLAQVTHYLAISGAKVCDVAVLIGGQDFRVYTVERDEDLVRMLVDAEVRFWNEHIQARVPPAPITNEEAGRAWRERVGSRVVATDATLALLRELKELREAIKLQEGARDALELALKTTLTEASELVDAAGKTLVTWKEQTTKRVDVTTLRENMPEIAKQFTRETVSRVLRIK